jgi:hypothetical protein
MTNNHQKNWRFVVDFGAPQAHAATHRLQATRIGESFFTSNMHHHVDVLASDAASS